MPASVPDGRSLVGDHVRLDLAASTDADDLFAALDDDRVFAAGYNRGQRPTSPADWSVEIEQAAADGRVMYVVRRVNTGDADRVVGTTSLGDIDIGNERAHIGWTAYSPALWGSVVNPECKFLLLRHAFDDCGLGRVKIQTDSINTRSQAAIAKLGATREGVLRRHMRRADGSWRDTVVFSVIVTEWPQVKDRLLQRLNDLSVSPRVAPYVD